MKNADQPINPVIGNGVSTSTLYGLTKREYFAGLAMQGLLANYKEEDYNFPTRTDLIADFSVRMADRLLDQLNPKP